MFLISVSAIITLKHATSVILQVALYSYAKDGVAQGFDNKLLNQLYVVENDNKNI